jgi:hypothetical protein
MGFLAQLGVVVLTQSVARKPFHDKCNIKKPTKNKAFSLNLATFGTSPTGGFMLVAVSSASAGQARREAH